MNQFKVSKLGQKEYIHYIIIIIINFIIVDVVVVIITLIIRLSTNFREI